MAWIYLEEQFCLVPESIAKWISDNNKEKDSFQVSFLFVRLEISLWWEPATWAVEKK